MSFYSIGQNEIKNLLEREHEIMKELETSESSNICNFQTIILKKEMQKIRAKLNVLSLMNPSNGDGLA